MTKCWKCFKEIPDLPKKISFRETCPFCNFYLHCCKNCKFFSPGHANQCLIPGTDPVSDRESMNFCEEFQLNPLIKEEKKISPEDVAKKLFKDL